jgi:hypothetical protein
MVKTYKGIPIEGEACIFAIGEITINFALLEELIADSINVLTGGEAASIFTTSLSFPRLLDILGAVYRQKHRIGEKEKLPNNLQELLKKAKEAEELRNKITHSIWHGGDTDESLTRIKRKVDRDTGLKIVTEIMKAQDLNKIAGIIENTVYLAQEFTFEILQKYRTILILPADQALLSDIKPEFKWLNVDGAIGYELSISKKYPIIEYSISKMGDDFIRDTKYTSELPLERGVEYFWRIRPIIATAMGYWSEIRAFTIK